jgi:PAS domain S-box-containing protein
MVGNDKVDYRALFANSPWPIFVVEVDSLRILDVNETAVERYGFSREELLSMKATELRPPEDIASFTESFRAHGRSEGQNPTWVPRSWRHRRKDGSVFPVDVWRMNVTYEGKPAQMALVQDATARVRMEEQLRQAHKMEAVGLLAGGIAHDFNNLLAVILGEAERAENLLSSRRVASAAESMRVVVQTAQRAAGFTAQLLAFSRNQILKVETLDLSEVVSGFGNLMARIVGAGIDVRVLSSAEPLPVQVDRSQVDQVLLNLCTNARQAMPEGGRLSIATSRRRVDREFLVKHPWASLGEFGEVQVADSGCGMDAPTLRRAFEPFFTTRSDGTGLGLAVVYGIARQHGGCVGVESSPGAGTTVRLLLPLREAAR